MHIHRWANPEEVIGSVRAHGKSANSQSSPPTTLYSVCDNLAVHVGTTVTFDGVLHHDRPSDFGISPGTSITGAYLNDEGEVVLISIVREFVVLLRIIVVLRSVPVSNYL